MHRKRYNMNTFKIYGKAINLDANTNSCNFPKKADLQATAYYEIPYTEYYEDGTIKSKGTEDFSYDRKITELTSKVWCIRKPNGRLGKTGNVITDFLGYLKIRTNKKDFTLARKVIFEQQKAKHGSDISFTNN